MIISVENLIRPVICCIFFLFEKNNVVFSFAIWNTIMGTSLLAMPWSVERAGLLMGLLLMFVIAGLCLYTSNRILKVQALHGKYFYKKAHQLPSSVIFRTSLVTAYCVGFLRER